MTAFYSATTQPVPIASPGAVTGVDWERTGTRSEAGTRAGTPPMIDLSRTAWCWSDTNAASILYGVAAGSIGALGRGC